ncbi:hypothetical protein QJS10_CPB20g01519 [Acorus calamus]|uniref:Uncharacterized protein n=1 Tax=Acorus calamus TaxID=4465 RepID=A0AAV9CCU2_ACOCL|nr:hypothetical protein QJS10_CPB20g01519 [Acorus calamus]
MKLVWCPETATKAYIDTVKALSDGHNGPSVGSNVAELVAAMAGGWRAQVILESWSSGDGVEASLGLSIAASHTRGRHVCVVPDEASRSEYISAVSAAGAAVSAEVVVMGEEVGGIAEGVDFLVVDGKRKEETGRVMGLARMGGRGAVVVCVGGGGTRIRWRGLVGEGRRVVRSVVLPIGRGIEIVHVAGLEGTVVPGRGRWIKHFDQVTGEEHVFRRP